MEKRKKRTERGKQRGESRGAEWGRVLFEDKTQAEKVLSNRI